MWQFIIFLTLCFASDVLCYDEYNWREYNGKVYDDAFIAGKDINGNPTYVGQAYYSCYGIITSQIYLGHKEVIAPVAGGKNITRNVKILCGSQENFHWVVADRTNVHLVLLKHQVVIGGHEDGWKDGPQISYYVGRIAHNGETKIGKIVSINGNFFYVSGDKEHLFNGSYEVLVYDESSYDGVSVSSV